MKEVLEWKGIICNVASFFEKKLWGRGLYESAQEGWKERYNVVEDQSMEFKGD